MEQEKGPRNRTNGNESTGRRKMSVPTEDGNIDRRHKGKFPIKNIPARIGEPIHKAINELLEVLYKNAAAIPETLGVGRNGHIGLLMDAEVYANVSTTAYTRPTEPGPIA